MASYTMTVRWDRGESPFMERRYSRRHTWLFDGGAEVPASSSPHVVSEPMSDPAAVDPEVTYDGDAPADSVEAVMHEEAHEKCFIANSVRTEIVVEP